MRTGTILSLNSTEGFEPLGAFSQPVHRSYDQIRVALGRNLGPDFAHYLTRPDIDRDGRRISWIAETIGEPRRWIDLAPAEQAVLEDKKRDMGQRLEAWLATLDAKPEHASDYHFGLILRQALRVPGEEHLFVMNNRFFVTFWGFKRSGSSGAIDPLLLAPGRQGQGHILAAQNALPPSPPGRMRPLFWISWPRWLWAALALLLLVGLLSWLLIRWHAVPLPVIPHDAPIKGVPVEPTPPPSPADAAPAPPPAHPTPPVHGVTLPTVPLSPAIPSPPPPPAAPPKPLVLPKTTEPGPANFMQGIWRSRSGLHDPDGKPLEERYHFDGNGLGDITVTGANGRHCTGAARASMGADGVLSITEDPSLMCNDGRTVSGATTRCAPRKDGSVLCQGQNKSDGSEFGVQMEQEVTP